MVDYINSFMIRLRNDVRGLTAVEYAVLGGIIVAGIVALGTTFNTGIAGAFSGLFAKIK